MSHQRETLPIVGNLTKTCRYILESNKYCEKKVNSYVTRDDDRNKVRKYSNFCPEHTYIVDKSEDTENV